MALKKVVTVESEKVFTRDDMLKSIENHPQQLLLFRYFIPSVDRIGADVFMDCNLQMVVCPDSVKAIGSSAFARSGLREFNSSRNLKCIDDYAFEGCEHLESVSIAGVEKIGKHVFDDCPELKTVVCRKEIADILRQECLKVKFVEPEKVGLSSSEMFTKEFFKRLSAGDHDAIWQRTAECKFVKTEDALPCLVKNVTLQFSEGNEEIEGKIMMHLLPAYSELYKSVGWHSYLETPYGFVLNSVDLFCGGLKVSLSNQQNRNLFDFSQTKASQRVNFVFGLVTKPLVDKKYPGTADELSVQKKTNKKFIPGL